MKRTIAKLPWLLAVSLMAALLIYGLWPSQVEVELAEVVSGTLTVSVNDDGETRIREKYAISAPVGGRLLRLALHAGDAVKQGVTELARIEPNAPALLDARSQAECEARLQAAEASLQQSAAAQIRAAEALELADHVHARAAELLEQNAISLSEFEAAEHGKRIAEADVRSAEFAMKVAAFELEQARAAAAQYDANGRVTSPEPFRLVAPIDGQVLRVFVEDAGVVLPSTPLLELGDPQDLELEIDVLSSEAVRIQPGDLVLIDHWGGEETLKAIVRVVEPSAFLKVSALGVEEKRVNVIADFLDPWEHRKKLGDGFRVEARIVVDSTHQSSLKIPAGALFREGGSWNVYRVVHNVAMRCPVEIGANNGLETEIKSGLSAGDLVVLYPSNEVRDRVRIIESK